jgi:hydroxymethylglutaryl-CoA lyase
MKWCLSNPKYKKIYDSLGKPRPFDVTLRDGLQGLNKQEQLAFTSLKKTSLFHEIMEKHSPESIESGSLVSNHIYPIFRDTIDLYQYIESNQKIHNRDKLQNYIFVPNYEKCVEAIKYGFINHFSFVTSVSESFLLKNIRKSVKENWEELGEMIYTIDNHFAKKDDYTTKIYVSCVTECPIDGKLDNNLIVEKIVHLNNLHFDTICLSDTCGTIRLCDFTYIVDKCCELGVSYDKLALHLHVQNGKEDVVEKILFAAMERKIIHFDVSCLESGGCSVTIRKEELAPNLSYDLYYKALTNYILKKTGSYKS